MTQMTATAIDALVDRYLALWNEADPSVRRTTIETQWAPNAANYTVNIEAVGHDAIENRVTAAHEKYVATGEHRFQLHEPYVAHHGAVRVWWEMVAVADGTVAAVGQEFLVLDDRGRIVSDHQFPIPL
jgi:hypothetical protein